MKINIEPIGFERVKGAISMEEITELIEYGYDIYGSEFRDDALRALNMDASEHLEHISDSYMHKYIRDNLSYYEVTSDMQEEINRLKRQLEVAHEAQNIKTELPDYQHKIKGFFCDLLDIGYHTSNKDIINRITNLI